MTKDTLLLVDGHNLLFQMFYGMPSRIVNADGKAIQGTLGFVGALIRMIKLTEPSHIAVLFDGEHENPRTGLLPEYKANRPDYAAMPEEDTPFSQLPDICRALDFMGISHTECTETEADDVIAAYARTWSAESEVVIASWDSDFFQLISEKVSILRYRGKNTTLCTPGWLREKYGISPSQYADFKSLTGDAADNIRGAEKIGPKTAAKLLLQFGSLERILEHIPEIGRPSWQEALGRDAERLRLNYRLIHLGEDAPLPFSQKQIAYSPKNVLSSTEVLKGIHLK